MVISDVNIYDYTIYSLIALAAVLLLVLVRRLYLIKENEEQEITDAILNSEELERHAVSIAKRHMIAKGSKVQFSLENRMNRNFKIISSAYLSLNEYVKDRKRVTPASEWLLDNFYIVEEQVKEIRQNLSKKYYLQLPRLKNSPVRGYPRVYAIALELVSHTDGRFDEKALVSFITAYQSQALLSSGELWAIPLMIRMALIEHIKYVCEKIMLSQQQWCIAERLAEQLLINKNGTPEELLDIAKESMKSMERITPSFGEHLLNMLKRHGLEIAPIIHYIDERLSEQQTNGENITQLEHNEQAIRQVSIGNSITSLRLIATLDWTEVFESLSKVEQILRQDPDGTYVQMDFLSRDHYRHEIERLSKKSKISEIQVAKKAIECAAESGRHLGYYLFGKDKAELRSNIGYKEVSTFSNAFLYIASICAFTLLFTVPFIIYVANTALYPLVLGVLAFFALLIPASDAAISIINWCVTKLKTPDFLPKLELKEGIPDCAKAIVVIPTLLPNGKRAQKLIEQLEEYYLANREKNLFFALAGDFKDFSDKAMPGDSEIIKAAISGINGLNAKYAEKEDIFFYFNRERVYSKEQNRWMGWERKRGALVELNRLLKGAADTSYTTITGSMEAIKDIKYVITIDADTKLSMETAKKLIGTIMHPLNKAVVDSTSGIVTQGYGLLQPRISVDIISANATPFSRVFAGQGGIDIYTNAISDVYQDLFGEGIFTGKGIYDLDIFYRLLTDSIPDNTVLSHDLLEGSYIRTGLVTDIELIDGYPAKYNSFVMRLHRWVRGDWQLIPWLFTSIKNREGKQVKNPLNTISRWKILDNMRRSLSAPAALILIFAGLTLLPGNAMLWLLLPVMIALIPIIENLIDVLFARFEQPFVEKASMTIGARLKNVALQIFINIAFLPYQGYLMLNAIIKTLIRVFFTRKNLLEWVTAADMEIGLKNDFGSYIRRMWICPVSGVLIFLISMYMREEAVILSAVFFAMWFLAPLIAYRISAPEGRREDGLNEAELREVRRIARKTWSFFEEFVGALDNYLPPDNYQENPPNGIAHRTSPTNIGLLLISTMAARDFGYISTSDMLERLNKTLSTIEKMKKWKGHLYNWYDTITLEVLRPRYISTVDSGNFIGFLVTLSQGLLEYMKRPIVDISLAYGLRDTMELAANEHQDSIFDITRLDELCEKRQFTLTAWKNVLLLLEEVNRLKKPRWGYKLHKMTSAYLKDINDFFSWHEKLMTFTKSSEQTSKADIDEIEKVLHRFDAGIPLSELPVSYEKLILLIESNIKVLKAKEAKSTEANMLEAIKDELTASKQRVDQILEAMTSINDRVRQIAADTSFIPLFDSKRKLFSIGYNEEEEQLTKSYYDLLASEARQSSFIAIASGEVKKEHWFMLDRTLTSVDGFKGLVSWTGTMFEYLMPLLIMKNYENTLLSETYKFVVNAQKEYGKKRHVPWGVSESGYYSFDFRLNYQYKAFGIPSLGLKRGLINDTVVAPYATMLALMVEPRAALNNLLALRKDGIESPAYGFYEAVDYTPDRVPKGKKSSVVRSFMVHHQGMGFLAMNNLINNNVLQERFHSEPMIKATELLLQEKIPSKVIFAKDFKEKIEPFQELDKEELEYSSVFPLPQKQMPECHILSNGSYSVLLTDDGTGYSRLNNKAVSRWREESVGSKSGTFLYIKDIESNNLWSAGYNPVLTLPDRYRVLFSQDKVSYIRADEGIDTQTDIVVSPEDDVEVRRVLLTNHGQQPRVLEITSYFEVALTEQSADIAHPAFSNLFIKTEYHSKYNALLAVRRPREQHAAPMHAVHCLNAEGEVIGGIQYETDRSKFIGRGRSLTNPAAMEANHPLSNTVGPVLDPVMSIRARVRIHPGQTAKLSFVTGIPKDYDAAIQLIEKYHEGSSIERAFELAWTRSQVELEYLSLKSTEIELYRHMLSHILFISPLKRRQESVIKKNTKGQEGLWAYGVSGDLPIVLAIISKSQQADLVKELLSAHEYWRIKGFHVDLVFLNQDEGSYTQPLFNLLQDMISVSHARDLREVSGGVFVKQGNQMSQEDINLLITAARIVINGSNGSLAAQMKTKDKDVPACSRLWAENIKEYPNRELEQLQLAYFNGYGGFSSDGSEYVVNLSDSTNTPVPWINVVSNKSFGFQISESGSSYTWAENSRENKLTPWANDPTMDPSGEVVYLRDEQTGELWSITPQPIRSTQPYRIRHGFGYSIFEHNYSGIEQKMLQFAAPNEPIKLIKLTLKNSTDKNRRLSATYYVRPVMGVNDQQTAHYTYTEIHDRDLMLIRNAFSSDFPGRVMFIDTSEEERYYTGDRREFIGRFGALSAPAALCKDKLSGATGAGYDSCACIQVAIELKAGETKELAFTIGQTEALEEAIKLSSKYRSIDMINNAFNEVKAHWTKLLGTIKVSTPDQSMDFILNGWLLYQTLACRMWARSALYQSGGAYGFRDQLQDSMAMLYISPDITRDQILYHSSRQFFEGDVQHWWHPGTDKGIRTKFSDDLLWMPYVTLEYLKVTGDRSILEIETAYLDESCLKDDEDERYNRPCVSEVKTSLYEHCIRAIEHSLKFGQHGIPLMGSGDWNDGMNTVGNKGKGESVWLGWFLYTILIGFASICSERKDKNRADRYINIAKEIIKSIEENAWDGNWYRRAYFDNGIPLGSAENTECRIDSLAQSWAVISGAGRPDRIKEAFEAVEHYLINKDDGIILLLTPPFDEGDLEPGYIKSYLPGVRENGGQYTHAAVWVVMAYAKMGMGEKAWEHYNMLNPINHGKTAMEVARYKVEPYVMAADVYAVSPHTGRGGWTWYTGASGWMYRVGLQYILGLNVEGGKLVMNPCIPKAWTEYSITYVHSDTTYNISVKNPSKVSTGVARVLLDGKEIQDKAVELLTDGKEHNVEVLMG